MSNIDRKDFCCNEIYHHLIGPDGDGCELYLGYSSNTREFFIPYKKGAGGGVQLIYHCPWCGTNLPKTLRDELFDIIEKEYKIEINIFNFRKNKKIPTEFKTDEWWKKRGL